MSALALEIVTPLGVVLAARDVDIVAVRRDEPRFERGSEIVFLPRHGAEIVHIPECSLRYRCAHGPERQVRVGAGFAEVVDDLVTVAVPWARPID